MLRHVAAVPISLIFSFAACSKPPADTHAGADAAAPPASLSSAPPPRSSALPAELDDAGADDEVKPVYPLDGPADPLAQKYCAALHDLQETRRAACCKEAPGIVFTGECVRMLSAALRGKAVALAPTDVDKCVAAAEKTYDGCEWTGPHGPNPPEECRGIVHGAVARGERCRSSLECAGDMYCRGVGPTDAGRCAPPGEDGAACGGSVDALVAATREDTDRTHPSCRSFCYRVKCVPFAAEGAECKSTPQCGPSKQCVRGKCAGGPLPKAGEACPGDACERPALCLAGKCVVRQPAGAACTKDLECIGACLKPDAGAGVCGRKCGTR